MHLEESLKVEIKHSPSSELFFNERYPTINYGNYDDALNIRGFVHENDDTNYKTEVKQWVCYYNNINYLCYYYEIIINVDFNFIIYIYLNKT